MEQVKSQKRKAGKIYIIIGRNMEKVMSCCIKIFRIPFYQSKLYKIEIEEMEDQEDKY